jgi:hypothetical protein
MGQVGQKSVKLPTAGQVVQANRARPFCLPGGPWGSAFPPGPCLPHSRFKGWA